MLQYHLVPLKNKPPPRRLHPLPRRPRSPTARGSQGASPAPPPPLGSSGLVVSASAGRNKGRGAGAQGHCATGPAPPPARGGHVTERRPQPRDGGPRSSRRTGAALPNEAPAATTPGRGRWASRFDRRWGRGEINALCLEIRRLSPVSTLSRNLIAITGAGPAPGPR